VGKVYKDMDECEGRNHAERSHRVNAALVPSQGTRNRLRNLRRLFSLRGYFLKIGSQGQDFTLYGQNIRMSLPRQDVLVVMTYYHIPTTSYVVATTKLREPNMSPLSHCICFRHKCDYLMTTMLISR